MEKQYQYFIFFLAKLHFFPPKFRNIAILAPYKKIAILAPFVHSQLNFQKYLSMN